MSSLYGQISTAKNSVSAYLDALKKGALRLYGRAAKRYEYNMKKNAVKVFDKAAKRAIARDPSLKHKLSLSHVGKEDAVLSVKKVIEHAAEKAIAKRLPATVVYTAGKMGHIPSARGGIALLTLGVAIDVAKGDDITTQEYQLALIQMILIDAGVLAVGLVGWPAVLAALGINLSINILGPELARGLVEAAIRDAQDLAKTINVEIRDKSGNVTAVGLPGQGGWVTDVEMDYSK